MRRLIHGNAAEYELENHAREYSGSIRDDGLRKVLAGKTTLEEVLRVTNEASEA
ncbi:type II secretion system protein GspE, partial [Acinetobacter baumannii]